MIRGFATIRRRLLAENRFTRYLAYAAGEIVLVVVGILIALQINNWNDARKDRAREISYMRNIREDVSANIREMDEYLATREESIAAAKRILVHFEGKPIEDVSAFNADSIGIYNWRRPDGEVTYLRFALLSNPAIKDGLLDIEAMYRKLKGEEDHFRFDSETLLYRPLYITTDLGPMLQDYTFRMSKGREGSADALHPRDFDPVLHNLEAKNGFWMAILEFDSMNGQMRELTVTLPWSASPSA